MRNVRDGAYRTFRKLGPAEYAAHLGRLRPEDRALRFGYGSRLPPVDYPGGALLLGAFERGSLCGVGELHFAGGARARTAEAAFTVEAAFQDDGLGKALFDRITYAARNRGISRLLLLCDAGNSRMLHIAETAGAGFERQGNEVWATIDLPPATLATVMLERADDLATLIVTASRACVGITANLMRRLTPVPAC